MHETEAILELLRRHGISPSDTLGADLDALVRARIPFAPPSYTETWSDEPAQGPSEVFLPGRYRPIGLLGQGGMGRVMRVHDATLGRIVAMKIAHHALTSSGRSRFLAEAQVVAQLQHPGIVPVYDLGTLGSGEPYFTMPIVEGPTLGALIRRAREEGLTESLRRLLDAFHAAADAVGYAHARGVVHRDLKPDNIIVGEHGATVIVDWGLAKILDAGGNEPPVQTSRTLDLGGVRGTLDGAVIGTLGYMPPEQARGELHLVDARADVHALGATLYEILTGAPPFSAPDRFEALTQVVDLPPLPISPQVPDELAEIAMRCLEKDPAARPEDASVVADAVGAWLAGTHRRERALAEVAVADRSLAEIGALRTRARQLRGEARGLLREIGPHGPQERKRSAWALEDEALQSGLAAELLESDRIDALHAALRTDPDLAEAHDRLAEHFRARHAEAEAEGDPSAGQLLHLLRAHDVACRHRDYLDGTGSITLVTEPPGARVHLFRYEVHDRRLLAVPCGPLGATPLDGVRLPMGSYRLDLHREGRETVRCPVHLPRSGAWDAVAPGDDRPTPLALPALGALGPDDCLVPAGWFLAGGDPLAEWPRPRRRLWVDGFVIRRLPVTSGELVAFLDDLVAQGRSDEAEAYEPRVDGMPVLGRTSDGRFTLRPDPDGDEWFADHPAVLVDWHTARAFAAWEAERTGLPWRLPRELEWEKAARGVDGRLFPWGDFLDPSWTRIRASLPGRATPARVGRHPIDASPYGVCDLAGNVHEWCEDPFDPDGPPDHLRGSSGSKTDPDDASGRVVRGGAWHSGERWARSASRGVTLPNVRESVLGFRLVRSWPAIGG